MDSWGALLVIANILKGSRAEHVKEKVMVELCRELVDPDRCRVRTVSILVGCDRRYSFTKKVAFCLLFLVLHNFPFSSPSIKGT